jgi:tRNA A-37 threonylcarbamoyl transferase component Bud32
VSLDTTTALHRTASQLRDPRLVFEPGEPGGTLTVDPAFAAVFSRVGLTSAGAFIAAPGEVVSGHPDRHVARLEVPGASGAFYLKRQHVVGWREKWRNHRAGFGWVSRCEREAAILRQLRSAGLPAPRVAAFGTHGSRAFLVLEQVVGVELRRLLSDNQLSLTDQGELARNLGRAVAAIHAAGFSTPDLTAKHVLVHPDTLTVTFLDWQSAQRSPAVSTTDRADALGALHASLAHSLASRADRARTYRAYSESFAGPVDFTRLVLRAAARHADRRSVRDQLQPLAAERAQRLVWLAGEAVCVVPEAAPEWPKPAIAPPFYGCGPVGATTVRFAGRDAVLIRGVEFAPVGRLRAWMRSTPWRSPGVTAGRVLFHLERYGIPAPQLIAFGQRLTDRMRAEWFVLHEAPSGVPLGEWLQRASATELRDLAGPLTEFVRKLHATGCVLRDAAAAFAVCGDSISITDPLAVRIVRRVSRTIRERDVRLVTHLLEAA